MTAASRVCPDCGRDCERAACVDRRVAVRRILVRYLSEQLIRPITFPELLNAMCRDLDPHLAESRTYLGPEPQLDDTEQAALSLVADGLTYIEIAMKLDLTHTNIKNLMARLLTRLGAANAAQAVAVALRTGALR